MPVIESSRKLRVLVVDPSGLLWGSERALLDLLRHLDRARYEITLATPLESQLRAPVEKLGIRVLEGPLGMLHRRGAVQRARALFWLAWTIGRVKPHVIHVNEAGAATLV